MFTVQALSAQRDALDNQIVEGPQQQHRDAVNDAQALIKDFELNRQSH